jgi:hypothetical protein
VQEVGPASRNGGRPIEGLKLMRSTFEARQWALTPYFWLAPWPRSVSCTRSFRIIGCRSPPIARQRGWSEAETAGATFQAGIGHSLSPFIMGLVVWIAGVAFVGRSAGGEL